MNYFSSLFNKDVPLFTKAGIIVVLGLIVAVVGCYFKVF